jgi:hypothetical protein
VLEQLREGLTNIEIAGRLGVSADAVKYHISNMLGKLQLPDRHALAAWAPDEEGHRQGHPAAVLATALKHAPTLRIVGTGLAMAAVAVVLLWAIIVARRDPPGEADPTAAAIATTSTASQTPGAVTSTPNRPGSATPSTPTPLQANAGSFTLRLRPGQFDSSPDSAGSWVFDTLARRLVKISDEDYGGIWWRPGTVQAVVELDGKLGLYDAVTASWRISDWNAPLSGAWSPDGRFFAFTWLPGPRVHGSDPARRWTSVLDFDAMRYTTLGKKGGVRGWSPDGRYLVLQRQNRELLLEMSSGREEPLRAWKSIGWLGDRIVLGRATQSGRRHREDEPAAGYRFRKSHACRELHP